MGDIESRIRLSVDNADAAVREVMKIKEAYDAGANAARGLSAAVAGGADPFAKATMAGSGVVAGGQSPADVAEREARNQQYRQNVRDRETQNRQYNSGYRQIPGQVGGAFNVAEAAASGRGGSALGGAAQGLGALLGGPLGMGLLAAGAIGMGVQKFAESAFGRLETVWGSGMSQRLGMGNSAGPQNMITGFARTGVPMEMVQGFFQSASNAGFDLRGGSPFVGMGMEAMANLGLDPGMLGSLFGALSRSGNVGMGGQYNLYSMMKGTFGQANVGTFAQELTRSLETQMQRGVNISQEEAARQANMIGAYAQMGGLTPTGAVALNQIAQDRAANAGRLQTPEDIIALQAIRSRNPEMSLTDAMIYMEQNPTETNRAVFERLQGVTGGDVDQLRLRARAYLGPGASMSQIDAFIRTQGAGPVSDVIGEGLDRAPWMNRPGDGSVLAERKIFAARQMNALKGVEEASLEVTTALQDLVGVLTGQDRRFKAENVGLMGYNPAILQDEQRAATVAAGVRRQSYFMDISSAVQSNAFVDPSIASMVQWELAGMGSISDYGQASAKIASDYITKVQRNVQADTSLGNLEATALMDALSDLKSTFAVDDDAIQTSKDVLAVLGSIYAIIEDIGGGVYTDGIGTE